MIEWLQAKAFGIILAAVPIGLVVSLLYQFIKKAIERETILLERTPKWAHRFYFAAITAAVTAAAGLMGFTVDCSTALEGQSCLSAVNQEQLTLVVEWLLAVITGTLAHAATKKKK
jgi:hypothetical protein